MSASDQLAGAALLDGIAMFLRRFVAYPSRHALIAHTLWLAHTHVMDAWESTPRIAFLSPEPASGKTRALEISELLVPNPIEAVSVSAAYLFRRVGADGHRPTLLFDEVDTVFGPRAREHEDVRGLLNAGHRKGAIAGRCVVRGKTVETVDYPAYCAVALAGLGDLPDTILTRSIVVRMRRRLPSETIEPYRRRIHGPQGHALRDELVRWAKEIDATVVDTWPAMPVGVEDRDADVWEALLAVADAAEGSWPDRARAAAMALVAEAKQSTPSLGIRLLQDLRSVFGDADVLSTEDILNKLHALEESPWAELVAGKPLNARGLAQRLKQYDVASKNVRVGTTTLKGYGRVDLADAWSRYLPLSPRENATSATSATKPSDVADVADVADLWGDEETAQQDSVWRRRMSAQDRYPSPQADGHAPEGFACHCGSTKFQMLADGGFRCLECHRDLAFAASA